MYKIFVNEKVIILTNVQDKTDTIKYFSLEEMTIEKIFKKLDKKKRKPLVLYHHNEQELLPKFAEKFKLVKAAGGVVINEKNEILFIKRKGLWDLPKGKLDAGESLSECALREVKEETGIKELCLIDFCGTTYHIFLRDEKYQLKETHWYTMRSTSQEIFTPQIEEDIEKVKWKKLEKLSKTLKKSYPNIRELFANELNKYINSLVSS